MKKELEVVQFEVVSQPGRTEKTTKISVRMIDLISEILTQEFSKHK
jgi:hypothetical protein